MRIIIISANSKKLLEMPKVSICIPTYNRFEMTMEAIQHVYHDERVGEVIIVDDCSNMDVYMKLVMAADAAPKIKLFRNEKNLDCYLNKREAVSFASNDFVCLWDSDNIFTTEYLDRIYSYDWSPGVIFQPSFASPHFDYTRYERLVITKNNVASYMQKPLFPTLLNTCNFFVNRDEYLSVFDDKVEPVTSDSIYFNYCWIAAGNSIFVVPNLSYTHRVHSQSHYQNNVHRTPNLFHEHTEQKLMYLT